MALSRILEPEAMDTPEEVREYDAMDHGAVNGRFAEDVLTFHGPARGGEWLDAGTGTARIPIEIARRDWNVHLRAVDLSPHMIARAREVVASAGLSERIRCEVVDAKAFPFPDSSFEAVVSNTIVHHIPDPRPALQEMARLVAPRGTLFIRDLARPADEATLDHLVQTYAGDESPRARQLFADSLRAALTLPEIRAILHEIGIPPEAATMTSDRHWTIAYQAPGSAA